MGFEVVPLAAVDIGDFSRCLRRSLGPAPFPLEERLGALLDPSGSFVALDGATVVGVLGALRFRLSTPGGPDLDAAGTTTVGVLPTHRRQGVLTALMAVHLAWAKEISAEAVGLWASEPAIYPRFGFGLATRRGALSVQRAGVLLPEAPELELSYVEPQEAAPRLEALYEAQRGSRAGAPSRNEAWWTYRRWQDDPAVHRPFGPAELVEARRDGAAVGYLQYRRWVRWEEGEAKDVVRIEELLGDGPTRRRLWRFLLSMDLVAEIAAFNLPPDDEIAWILQQGRGAKRVIEDGLWLAPLDPAAFLTKRAYLADGRIVLRIKDAGTFAVEARDGRAEVEPTGSAPEIEVATVAAPALLWGESRPAVLRDAGLLTGTPDAVQRAARLFSTDRRPWCPERF